jgi:VIT1/CCC1 family predicted Fe2+/Mn2+ transporter
MMVRDVVLAVALVFIAAFAFLTLRVLFTEGLDILVAASLVVLALLGFGILGALTSGDDR